ncbi:histone-lysine N-methyltransferase set-1-like [Xenopus laevis]|uniref:Histone-lysine N-methyltransferase set-1-like n=1 Tax=Xenopus laevis TaxID=8355 RepID=A0A8J1MLM3_XENLA|nr:histone-lysine N-methyltransferase set-1-like [Xenopus laevis]XP_041441935.1 histone-lysine N-methyltransferase set-1-like [Xenopus laevis]
MDVIIAHYKHEKPTPSQVQSYLKRQGWLKHAPTVEDILLYWEASEKPKPDAIERKIQSFVKTQQWPGLAVVDDPVKGQKVVTLQDFKKGDYICDYHGPVISAKEGERLMRSVEQNEMGYLYFFLDRGNKRLCIDAQNVPCSCHSELPTTYGRKINHSRKRPNLKPMVKYFPDDTRPHILFSANKAIDAGTELLFDYGVTRKSFSGEGADLPWIDE